MTSRNQVFRQGFRATFPYFGGIVPFGVLYATIATNVGFPWWLTILFSIVVFAGSSQLVFIDLFTHLQSSLQAVLGSNIVNARHLIYSAGVTHQLSTFPRRWRLVLAYLLTDQLYAVSLAEADEIREIPEELQPWFYFGSGMFTWSFWVASTAAGIAFGHVIPSSWNLGFSIPLMFMPLVFSVSKTKFAHLASLFAIVFVFLFQSLPFGLGIFFAILCASILAYFFEMRSLR
ncbi:MAG TPA: AzlC family ABC transporter permease [Bdellovibrionales bacterium]|nr:AzlC family ABC transporter permease [Bdellovibrionales bacterium]